jgi:protein phosphatase PTC1
MYAAVTTPAAPVGHLQKLPHRTAPGSPTTPATPPPNPSAAAVLPGVGYYGLASDANARFRPSDEDASTVIPTLSTLPASAATADAAAGARPLSRSGSADSSLTSACTAGDAADDASAFLAVYDGHGGDAVARHAAVELHRKFAEALAEQDALAAPRCVPTAFADAYAAVDADLRAARMFNTGSTAVTCFVHTVADGDDGLGLATRRRRKVLTTANVGDARAVLCRAGSAVRLSRDHRAGDADERARIEAGGGFVCARRVNGILEVSRALGDHSFKSAVISAPSVNETVLGEADEFLILACDGLWDFVAEEKAVSIASNAFDDGATAADVANVLVRAAIAAGGTDNVTVLCTKFFET